MTDTITLPRAVVEHVMYHLNRGDADAVCWADGVIKPALEQSQGEQEPVAGVVIRDGLPCLLQDRHIKSTDHRVYTHPQPKRKPLTEQQINDHRLAFAYASDDLPDPWDFKQGVKAAERAHGIGGEE